MDTEPEQENEQPEKRTQDREQMCIRDSNEDELKEIKKLYDFADFCDSLIRYSSGSDKGFIRMKTYSNAFIVTVQIDRFTAQGDR